MGDTIVFVSRRRQNIFRAGENIWGKEVVLEDGHEKCCVFRQHEVALTSWGVTSRDNTVSCLNGNRGSEKIKM